VSTRPFSSKPLTTSNHLDLENCIFCLLPAFLLAEVNMDFTVVEAINAPNKPVIAVKMGSVRRQVRMEVNSAFQMPKPTPGASPTVQISLFNQLASQALIVDEGCEESICTMKCPAGTIDGQAQPCNVKLKIRRHDGRGSGGESPSKRLASDKLEDARDYLSKHQLQRRIQSLIQDVLKAQPDEPYSYMVECLKADRAFGPFGGADGVPELPGQVPDSSPTPKKMSQVPKPPEKPKSSEGFVRKPSPQAAAPAPEVAPTPALAPAPVVCGYPEGRSEARTAARVSINMVLRNPRVLEQAQRQHAQSDFATQHASRIISQSKERLLEEVMEVQDPRVQARVSLSLVFKNVSAISTSEYYRAVARWSVVSLIRSSAQLIKDGDPKRCEECFSDLAFVELPKPFVALVSDGGNWGAWCK